MEALNSVSRLESETFSPAQGVTPVTTGRLHNPNDPMERTMMSVGDDPATPIQSRFNNLVTKSPIHLSQLNEKSSSRFDNQALKSYDRQE